jgi:D-arabinose 1-dehydrogenase-like Zn-dependent alcohol dehydrogenase
MVEASQSVLGRGITLSGSLLNPTCCLRLVLSDPTAFQNSQTKIPLGGDCANCLNAQISGISYDGGYGEYMLAPAVAVARMPESLDPAEAAPLMCACLTTFNSLRHSGALPSELVAVQGIGGLGHLGIQFARKLGYRVAAVGRGPENAAVARKLGAHIYIDSTATNAVRSYKSSAAPASYSPPLPAPRRCHRSSMASDQTVPCSSWGRGPIPPTQLIRGKKNIQGWYAGTATDSEDTLRFAEMSGVRPMIERRLPKATPV